MAHKAKLMDARDLGDGSGKIVSISGMDIAVFRVDGRFFAIDNKCLHRGGPLGDGELRGKTIVCPWHGWKYDVSTGSLDIIPTLRVNTYNVVVEGPEVFIEIPRLGQTKPEGEAAEGRRGTNQGATQK
jgi:nitrite reductase/ring-hydroxylating ferredoxin subunit